MVSSKDILEFVTEKYPTGEFREALEVVARYMFEWELREAGLNHGLNPVEKKLLEKECGHAKLEAVKQYKRRTGCRLLEAKKAVEEYMLEKWHVTHFADLNK